MRRYPARQCGTVVYATGSRGRKGTCTPDFAPLPDRASPLCLAYPFALIGRDDERGTKQNRCARLIFLLGLCAARVIYPESIIHCSTLTRRETAHASIYRCYVLKTYMGHEFCS